MSKQLENLDELGDDIHDELMTAFNTEFKVLTRRQLKQVENVAGFLSDEDLADYLGVSRPTMLKRISTDPEFAMSYRIGRTKPIVACGNVVLNKAIYENDLNAATFYLKTRGKWKETQQLEHSVEHVPRTLDDFYGSDDDDAAVKSEVKEVLESEI